MLKSQKVVYPLLYSLTVIFHETVFSFGYYFIKRLSEFLKKLKPGPVIILQEMF